MPIPPLPSGYILKCNYRLCRDKNTADFSSFHDWEHHMQVAHDKTWTCQDCAKAMKSFLGYCAHLKMKGCSYFRGPPPRLFMYSGDGSTELYVTEGMFREFPAERYACGASNEGLADSYKLEIDSWISGDEQEGSFQHVRQTGSQSEANSQNEATLSSKLDVAQSAYLSAKDAYTAAHEIFRLASEKMELLWLSYDLDELTYDCGKFLFTRIETANKEFDAARIVMMRCARQMRIRFAEKKVVEMQLMEKEIRDDLERMEINGK